MAKPFSNLRTKSIRKSPRGTPRGTRIGTGAPGARAASTGSEGRGPRVVALGVPEESSPGATRTPRQPQTKPAENVSNIPARAADEPRQFPFYEFTPKFPEWEVDLAGEESNYFVISRVGNSNPWEDVAVPTLFFSAAVLREAMYVVKQMARKTGECGGFFLTKRLNAQLPHFLLYDHFLVGQEASGGEVDLCGRDCKKYYEYLRSKWPGQFEKQMHRQFTHWHSHGNLGLKDWSHVDHDQQTRRDQLACYDDYRFYVLFNADSSVRASMVQYYPVFHRFDQVNIGLYFGCGNAIQPLTKERKKELDAQMDKLICKKGFAGAREQHWPQTGSSTGFLFDQDMDLYDHHHGRWGYGGHPFDDDDLGATSPKGTSRANPLFPNGYPEGTRGAKEIRGVPGDPERSETNRLPVSSGPFTSPGSNAGAGKSNESLSAGQRAILGRYVQTVISFLRNTLGSTAVSHELTGQSLCVHTALISELDYTLVLELRQALTNWAMACYKREWVVAYQAFIRNLRIYVADTTPEDLVEASEFSTHGLDTPGVVDDPQCFRMCALTNNCPSEYLSLSEFEEMFFDDIMQSETNALNGK